MKDKFGKSSLNIIKVKKDFFDNNDKLLKENSKIFKLYSKQPKRTKCKNCNSKLKYNQEQIELVKSIQNDFLSSKNAVELLDNKYKLKISCGIVSKIWKGSYGN